MRFGGISKASHPKTSGIADDVTRISFWRLREQKKILSHRIIRPAFALIRGAELAIHTTSIVSHVYPRIPSGSLQLE
jgi:hypothetical protein